MKTVVVGILCFLVGIGLFYGWTKYTQLKEQNTQLQQAVTQISTIPTVTVESPTSIPTLMKLPPKAIQQKAKVEGTLGYPAEGIPPLLVYAINANDKTKYNFVETAQNVSTFQLEVDPGTYYFVAYPKGNSKLAGGYTKAVPCGLSVSCNDHSFILVTVKAGETNTEVQVKDWYAPDGTFPPKPN
ncbi:hypothetical protein HY029_00800 [Candidatus Gottesmanbacteria bacterium]|nr:hypothetical protein [Candidatus Gottesmanbacteria bacterium]